MNNFEPERLSSSTLKSAIFSKTPCAKHQCENLTRCIELKLACKAYKKYISLGSAPKPQRPDRITYLRLYGK